MNDKTKENLYLIAMVSCSVLIGVCISQLVNIINEKDTELDNIIAAENIINECKNRYNQEYMIKNDLVIEFVDGGKDE